MLSIYILYNYTDYTKLFNLSESVRICPTAKQPFSRTSFTPRSEQRRETALDRRKRLQGRFEQENTFKAAD
jgi:hypothetical protein